MIIEIEIGSPEQKELIRKELENCILSFFTRYGIEDRIERIIIPEDFQEKVRQITGESNYMALREDQGHAVEAKTLLREKCLLFSPILFTSANDEQTRCHIYLHEALHVASGENIVPENIILALDRELLFATNWLYDEYCANRDSTKIVLDIFENRSEILRDRLDRLYNGTYTNLLDLELFPKTINELIVEMKSNSISRELLFPKLLKAIGNMYLSLTYYAAFAESLSKEFNINSICAVNDLIPSEAIELIDLFRNAHSNNIHRIGFDSIGVWDRLFQQVGLIVKSQGEGLWFFLA